MAPDINWIGLLMNPSEFNKYLSPKMTYIYSYLENICFYYFKPDEENKIKYKEIIHKMINFLFKYSGSEKELREYLSKTDTIKKKKLINSLHFF